MEGSGKTRYKKTCKPLWLDAKSKVTDLKGFTTGCEIDLDKMLDSCPFRRDAK